MGKLIPFPGDARRARRRTETGSVVRVRCRCVKYPNGEVALVDYGCPIHGRPSGSRSSGLNKANGDNRE